MIRIARDIPRISEHEMSVVETLQKQSLEARSVCELAQKGKFQCIKEAYIMPALNKVESNIAM